MTDYVWVSNAFQKIGFPVQTDISENNVEAAIEGDRLNKKGLSVPSELCPTKIWAVDVEGAHMRMPEGNLPDLFFAKSQWIVSARAAVILRRFDLGGGALYPVIDGVYREDKVTRVPGDWFCWILGNTKEAFLPEQTPNKRRMGVSGQRWKMPWELTDGGIVVSSNALDGSDVWLDHGLFQAIFISRPLGDALEAAGLGEAFFLHKARVA